MPEGVQQLGERQSDLGQAGPHVRFAGAQTPRASDVHATGSPTFQPQTIGLELVRGCNFACKMCPVTVHASDESQRFQFMEPGLLRQLAAEIDRWPGIETIWLFHFGEPLAHPHYRECLEILHGSSVARKATVIQHTNASLLNGERAEAILEVPVVKKLVFSFDGFGDQESYERLRGPHFQQVLKNIQQFAAQARKRRPELVLATCTILPREGDVPGLKIPERDEALRGLRKLFAPMGISVEARDLHAYNGNDDLEIAGRHAPPVAGGCRFVEQNSLYFTVHGFAQPCCGTYSESHQVGRFPDQSFDELLNSESMRALRHRLRLDQRQGIPFCEKCPLSLADLGTEGLREFWTAKEQQGELTDPDERRHLLGETEPRVAVQEQPASASSDPAAPAPGGNGEAVVSRACAELLAKELDEHRHQRAARWTRRLCDRSDLRAQLSAAFRQLQDDSLLFSSGVQGYHLQPSISLHRTAFVDYPLALGRSGLCGLMLAFSCELRPLLGQSGIEIVSPNGQVVVHQTLPASAINPAEPVRFDFPPLEAGAAGVFRLRVFARGVDVPVRVLEWRKFPWGGLLKTKTRAFCALLFSPED